MDIVIPNAGIASAGLLYWLNTTQYDSEKPETITPPPPPQKVIDINYHAVFNTVHAAIWYFKNFPGSDLSYSKNIVFVSSMGGYNHMPTTTCYNSSKWGVRGLFWSLRNVEQLLGEGKPKFRANLIAPTYVSTNMTRGIKERVKETNSPIKVAEVSDVVHVVLRMVSDEGVKGMCSSQRSGQSMRYVYSLKQPYILISNYFYYYSCVMHIIYKRRIQRNLRQRHIYI